jgi:purine-binding chemotaxis protein CheW
MQIQSSTTEASGVHRLATSEPQMMIVSFVVGAQIYALPVSDVVEVVRLSTLVILAGGPAHVCGVLNRAGIYLPVLQAGTLLNEDVTYQLSSQVIIVRHQVAAGFAPVTFGLLVDQVRDVFAFRASQLTSCDGSKAAVFFRGIVDTTAESVLLLDTARLAELAPCLEEQGMPWPDSHVAPELLGVTVSTHALIGL